MYLVALAGGIGLMIAVPSFSKAAGEFLNPYPLRVMLNAPDFGVTNEALCT